MSVKAHLKMILNMLELLFNKSKIILITLLIPFLLGSCNVHEWPEIEEERFPFVLNLIFDDDLPLYKEVYYTRQKVDQVAEENFYDIRYLVNVYKVEDENDVSREIYASYVFSKPYESEHDYQAILSLPEGNYRFRIWSDHVGMGTQSDLFYKTSDFTEIILDESGSHPGNNEMRDAFRGNTYGSVYDPDLYEIRNGSRPENSATATMQRPMGRYEFISTDMDEFLDKVVKNIDSAVIDALIKARSEENEKDTYSNPSEKYWNGLTRDEVSEAAGLDKYTVEFSYNAFMPSSYNMYTDRPSDSSTGIKFQGKMSIGEEGMQMGFDYVLVDENTTMNLNMKIYNADGEMVASTAGVEVPIVRSKNTVVKGTFLTANSSGGVFINPDFEGDDYNIEIH